jgi:hypothetical protein
VIKFAVVLILVLLALRFVVVAVRSGGDDADRRS